MRSRHLPVVLTALGVVLLAGSIGAGSTARSQAEASTRAAVSSASAEQAAVLDDYLDRTRSIVLLTAANPAFTRMAALPGTTAAKVRRAGRERHDVNAALAYLERLFPGSIGEACFIDRGGAELARVTRGERAAPADLSKDERGNPFFAPTFALRPGQVYHAAPYVSPDTGEWVISNSTPLVVNGRKQVIVHFEVTVESFRRFAERVSSHEIAVVDAKTGRVVFDSRHAQPAGVNAPLGRPGDARFLRLRTTSADRGFLEVEGRLAAYRAVKPVVGNANDWYVVALGDARGSLPFGVGLLPLLVGGLALVVLGVGIAAQVARHRRLVHVALTDPLTALGNRRRLLHDLEAVLRRARDGTPSALVLFDLDGFKAYNDTFGHPAGDALLVRLGRALSRAATSVGAGAYRLGGDEFCVVAGLRRVSIEQLCVVSAEALTEHGDGFSVQPSFGTVLLPVEASEAESAVRLADQRMYADKNSGRTSAGRQSADVLLRTVEERNPDLAARLRRTALLALAVGRRLGVSDVGLGQLQQAAELHDIGKVAIPDELLAKREPLTDEERRFVQEHVEIGARIVAAAPSLAGAATIVRATHERVDGRGYPDGLRGDAIPLGAQIIAVCDAFLAMTSDRSYRFPVTADAAVAELQRCAGSQFDGRVVAEFAAMLRQGAAVTP